MTEYALTALTILSALGVILLYYHLRRVERLMAAHTDYSIRMLDQIKRKAKGHKR